MLCLEDADGSRHEQSRILYSKKCETTRGRCTNVASRAGCVSAKDRASKTPIRKAVSEINLQRAGKRLEGAKYRVLESTWLKEEHKK